MAGAGTATRVEQSSDLEFRLQWLDQAQPMEDAFGAFCTWYAEQQLRDGLSAGNGGQPDLARLQQVVILTHLRRTKATREEGRRALAVLSRRTDGLGKAARELQAIFETASQARALCIAPW